MRSLSKAAARRPSSVDWFWPASPCGPFPAFPVQQRRATRSKLWHYDLSIGWSSIIIGAFGAASEASVTLVVAMSTQGAITMAADAPRT